MDYRQVTRKIGSKVQTVRQHYIAYRLLLHIENELEIPRENFQDRFSVMYLALRTQGVRHYLGLSLEIEPRKDLRPVAKSRLNALNDFATWMFGDDKRPPLMTDSRQVDRFGRILESKEAVAYLQRSENPQFDVALRTAGGDELEVVKLVDQAADSVELALTRAHHHRDSEKLQIAIDRFAIDAKQLLELFPKAKFKISDDAK